VARAQAQRSQRVNLKQDDVLHEMSALALSNISHYIISDEGQVTLAEGAPDNAMAAVQSIKRKTKVFRDKNGAETHREYDVELRLWDKPQPLKLTGRHVGLYPDRVEHVGKGGGPIELTQLSTEELLARHKALTEAAE
jgi:phage terminase small subunit